MGPPIFGGWGRFCSKVDRSSGHTLHVNLRIVLQGQRNQHHHRSLLSRRAGSRVQASCRALLTRAMLRSLREREAGVRRGANVEYFGDISRLCLRAKLEGHRGCVNGASRETLLFPQPSDAPRFLSDKLSVLALLQKREDPLLQLSHSLLRSA